MDASPSGTSYQVDVSASVVATVRGSSSNNKNNNNSDTNSDYSRCFGGGGGSGSVSAARRVGFRTVAMDSAPANATAPQRHVCVAVVLHARANAAQW